MSVKFIQTLYVVSLHIENQNNIVVQKIYGKRFSKPGTKTNRYKTFTCGAKRKSRNTIASRHKMSRKCMQEDCIVFDYPTKTTNESRH